MKKYLVFIFLSTMVFSCAKIPDEITGTFLSGDGVFIINEGNFRGGNGSLSFYSYDSSKIYNDLFLNIGRGIKNTGNNFGVTLSILTTATADCHNKTYSQS